MTDEEIIHPKAKLTEADEEIVAAINVAPDRTESAYFETCAVCGTVTRLAGQIVSSKSVGYSIKRGRIGYQFPLESHHERRDWCAGAGALPDLVEALK